MRTPIIAALWMYGLAAVIAFGVALLIMGLSWSLQLGKPRAPKP